MAVTNMNLNPNPNPSQAATTAMSSGMPYAPGTAGLGGLVGNWLGNQFNNPGQIYQEGMQPGIDRINQGVDRATGYISPWRQAGLSGLNDYMDMLKQYKNPQEMYNNIMGGWKMSQGAQKQMGGAMDAIQNRLATMGLTGSGQELKDLGQNFEDYAAKDQQQYLNNILGIGQTGLQGFNNLSNQGLNAGTNMGGFEMQGAQDIASMYNAIAAAQAAQAAKSNEETSGGLMGTLGAIGGKMGWL